MRKRIKIKIPRVRKNQKGAEKQAFVRDAPRSNPGSALNTRKGLNKILLPGETYAFFFTSVQKASNFLPNCDTFSRISAKGTEICKISYFGSNYPSSFTCSVRK